ncbi:hypothetical protein [Legionella yabuuchiae]|uniref:hypothetical protein n=1 Tax=Legionella yabuuchiae TaxID=376727 RepID=UPI0010562226|nr:hypothetical protein [Legionella yabuuchiae]
MKNATVTSYNRMQDLLGSKKEPGNDLHCNQSSKDELLEAQSPHPEKETPPKYEPESLAMTAILTACLGKKPEKENQPR